MTKTEPKRIYLSPPSMLGNEKEMLIDAFESNWIAPLGPHVNAFENEFAQAVDVKYAAALSSGTAALHLALLIAGVKPEDEVLTSSFTFVATTNAIKYVGAHPVFIDSDQATWNMDPNLLEEELKDCRKKGRLPAAVLVVDIVGQCANYDAITRICNEYEVPLIEDAAEALGAKYHDNPAGKFGVIGCFSFNGNKIITTSGGGMLVTDNEEWAQQARHLATQAREPVPYYEHTKIGYNYRMSNLLAAVGRGQLAMLDTIVNKRRANFEYYQDALNALPGVTFMPEPEGHFSTRWLSCLLIDPKKFKATNEDIRLKLESENIESRPLWKPMHLQPVFSNCRKRGGSVSEALFAGGLSLPSGTDLSKEDLKRVTTIIRDR